MAKSFVLLYFTILQLCLINIAISDDVRHEPGWCVEQGPCGFNGYLENGESRGTIPCYRSVPALKGENVTAAMKGIIREICPNLYLGENGEDTQVCCDLNQLQTLDRQLAASLVLFQRCPSCIENFRRIFCDTTCSPNQAAFINVTETFQNEGYEYPGVTRQNVYIEEEFANGLHDSCAGVIFPQTNSEAISLVCNGYSGQDCTTRAFLDYMGSTGNGIAPLDINFIMVGPDASTSIPTAPTPFQTMNPGFYTCAEQVEKLDGTFEEACSCTDCPLSCPAPPPLPESEEVCVIGSYDCAGAIMLFIYIGLVLLFFLYLIFTACCTSQSNTINYHESEQGLSDKIDTRPLVKPDDISTFDKLGKKAQDTISKVFRAWGFLVASYPITVLVLSIGFTVGMSFGIPSLLVTNDPIELWTAESSRVRQEKDFFDDNFGQFYRTEQVIMTLKPELERPPTEYTSYTGLKHNFTEILQKKYIKATLELQNRLTYMVVEYEVDGEKRNGTLNDICFQPLAPDITECTIMAIMNYWQNDPDLLDVVATRYDKIQQKNVTADYHDHLLYCFGAASTIQDTTPIGQSCLGAFGGPVFPYLAVGGDGEDYKDYNDAQALIMTFTINNVAPDEIDKIELTKAWEKEFIRIMAEWDSEYFDYAYFSERSPGEELERSAQSDLTVFIISYLVIFIYITFAMGSYSSCKTIPVDSKAVLGVAGIFVILGSVFVSIGFIGYIQYVTSLIVVEVVPFLILAIGADNVFVLTLEHQRCKRLPDETVEEHVARVFGEVAPSMLICSLTECVIFFLGALTSMPAVEQFAIAAGLAIFFDFMLQITAFLAVLTLDARRQDANRVDIFCCIKMDIDTDREKVSLLEQFFKNVYAPFLMLDSVRVLVMLVFTGLLCWCVALSSNMTIGLNQDLSVPLDSYVLDYFDYQEKYLGVGAPVYFVTKGTYNFKDTEAGQMICSSAGCNTYSLTAQISYASDRPEYWRIETPAQSWYDDYNDWLSPQGVGGSESCCSYKFVNRTTEEKEFCPSTLDLDCPYSCLSRNQEASPEEFMEYLPWFMIDNPGVNCNKGGHAAYGQAISINPSGDSIDGSYFFAYHSVCIKSTECTENLVKARELSDNITKTLREANDAANGSFVDGATADFEVYPYSIYYIYYEQYLTMANETFYQIGICLIPTFIFVFILLGFDLYSGLITVVTIVMIVVDTAGLCSLWGVDLNAVSLINLVAAIGLSVEFTSHVVRSYAMATDPTSKERVISSMANMGPAVFAGVALTNLPGIIVLHFATAQLIEVFFFRMCLVITLLGTVHGLIFLPVFLSYFGPPVNKAYLYEAQQTRRAANLKGATNKGMKIEANDIKKSEQDTVIKSESKKEEHLYDNIDDQFLTKL